MAVSTEQALQVRDALLPLVGPEGYRRLLTILYSDPILHAAGIPAQTVDLIRAYVAADGVESVPRDEVLLESDSKSRIYVVRTVFDDGTSCALVLKWYPGERQQQAAIEQQMNAYFRTCLAPHSTIGPVLAVVPLPAAEPLSVAILPYLGDTTLYDHLHRIPPHAAQVEALLRQASDTLAYTLVLGPYGDTTQQIHLTRLAPEDATAYFLQQIDSVVLRTFAASSQPLLQGQALLEQFTFFAKILGTDSHTAGLYYRGINPRNIMWHGTEQVEIDFEQDTIRSRFIDIVSLLENGLELTDWDKTATYPPCTDELPFAVWDQQRRQAWAALAQSNYLSHPQVEDLTAAFLDTTWRLERQYLDPQQPAYSHAERRLLLETARLFRHLQYVGYCKRNEEQALTSSKRLSSRYRQHFHAVWAKCALDNLLFPLRPEDACLPAAGRQAAMALRQTLETLPLPPVG